MIPNQIGSGNLQFRVLTTLGTNVLTEKLSFVQSGIYKVDVSSLSQGFYFLEVITEYGRQIEKFQISK